MEQEVSVGNDSGTLGKILNIDFTGFGFVRGN